MLDFSRTTEFDLGCLGALPETIESLIILDKPSVSLSGDLRGPFLKTLRWSVRYSKLGFRGSNVSRLQDLSLTCSKFVTELDKCDNMRDLYLISPDQCQFNAVRSMPYLHSLRVDSGSRIKSLDPLYGHPRVQVLMLHSIRVCCDASIFSTMPHLQSLDLDCCRRVMRIEELARCLRLRRLLLRSVGDIESISFIKSLKDLETFFFGEGKILDRNLTPIIELPKLRGAFVRKYRNCQYNIDPETFPYDLSFPQYAEFETEN